MHRLQAPRGPQGGRAHRPLPPGVPAPRLLHPASREIVTREKLLDTVWDYNAIPFTRTVDMHIAKLRKKIEDNPADPRHLVTVHRLGYKLTG
ncbi:MAG: helix-turn-helix domain-containing protein [Acidobacteriota bacterium]